MSALAPRVTAFLLNCDCSTFFRQKLSNNQGGMNRIYPVCQSTPNWAFQGPQNWCPKPSCGAPLFPSVGPGRQPNNSPFREALKIGPPQWYMVFLSFWWPQVVTLDAPGRRRDGPNAPFFGVVFSQTFSKPKSLRYTTNIPPQKSKWLFEAWITVFRAIFWFHYILHNKFSELQETEIQKYSQK